MESRIRQHRIQSRSRGVQSRDASLIEGLQTNQCDAPHQQNEGEKAQDRATGAGKAFDKTQRPLAMKSLSQADTSLNTAGVVQK